MLYESHRNSYDPQEGMNFALEAILSAPFGINIKPPRSPIPPGGFIWAPSGNSISYDTPEG
jgi:hypothetical protein